MAAMIPFRVLLVEDEPSIREPLARFLRREQFEVIEVADAQAARDALGSGEFDLALLDIMMPGEDGLSLARYVLGSTRCAVILLTARSDELDRIVGLELGADDYVAKPFSPRELAARMRAVLRRGARQPQSQEDERWAFDELLLERAPRRLIGRDGDPIALTGGEFRLLAVLAERAGRVVSRDDLLELTQGRRADVFDRSVDNQISRLRRKIERDPQRPSLIKTVRGGGYTLAAKVTVR
ncbi:MAG: response regulator transcription factor [Parvularcula sp.]|jgi:two-component system OmpR family response regulator|nr:response regulator transcription factor [Parvularcula sp.]